MALDDLSTAAGEMVSVGMAQTNSSAPALDATAMLQYLNESPPAEVLSLIVVTVCEGCSASSTDIAHVYVFITGRSVHTDVYLSMA